MELDLEQYRGKRVCVALSGGVDSVCLLHYLHFNAKSYALTLSALHIEHGIRGDESLRDCAFCQTLCNQLSVPLSVVHADVPALSKTLGVGLEEAGRAARYDAFRAVLVKDADVVVTAHHKNDVAETVLFRLARGTSLAGMRAITEREGISRPLLGITRAEIEAYAEEHGLAHAEDSTNYDESYARNCIRHTVLPALEKISAHAAEHIARFSSLAAADDDYLRQLAREKIVTRHGEQSVPVNLPAPLFSRACLICMASLGSECGGANLAEINKLKSLPSGKKVSLPSGAEAAREYGAVVFYRPAPEPLERPFEGVDDALISKTEGRLRADLDKFPAGCVVRTRREGDVIVPFGGGRKTLKKFLTDKKISARTGRGLLLIAKGEEIFAVVGVEISEKVKITESTRRIGYLK